MRLRRTAVVVGLLALLLNTAQPLLATNLAAVAQAAALNASGSAGTRPSHTPNTLARFRATGDAAGTTPATRAHPPANAPVQGPRTPSGTRPDQEPPTAGALQAHPLQLVLDASLQSGATLPVGGPLPCTSSEGLVTLAIAAHSVDTSQAALDISGAPPAALAVSAASAAPVAPVTHAIPTTTAVSSPSPSPLPTSVPTGTATSVPSPSPSPTSTPAASPSPTATATPPATTGPAAPLTLVVTQTQGGFPTGASQQLAQFRFTVTDGQGRGVHGIRLLAPLTLTLHYLPQELAALNTSDPHDLRLVWLSTGHVTSDLRHGTPAQSVPVTVDPTTQTLTAQLDSLQSGPLVLSAAISDANAASSEHFGVGGNQGDLSFAVPLTVPPSAGGLTPPLELTYSSAGPNERHQFAAPAPWVGDGWDLSLGSITYDSTTQLFYLNGIGGVSEPLLCCMTDSGGTHYFAPHHHPEIRVFTTSDIQHPQTTGAEFIVRTPDGLEYDLGSSTNSLRWTVSNGAKLYYEWDVNRVVRPAANTPAGYLSGYTVSYWQDLATSGGIQYVRDAGLQEIDANWTTGTNPTYLTRILFNIHWPGSASTDHGGATATQYETDFRCNGTPPAPTALRCDDPSPQSGWEPAPLTMSTLTLDSVTMQVADASFTWHTVRQYALSYANDTASILCYDPISFQQMACAGEHLLASVQAIPYQVVNGVDTATPSVQPIVFNYTGRQTNEYHDQTEKPDGTHEYDAQTWWQYLNWFSDEQSGGGETVTWATGYGNTHGVPNGSVTDPTRCVVVNCSALDPIDRQWSHQLATSLVDRGTNLTTTFAYQLNQPCGTGCTQDTWIPPNGWNACGDHGLPPTNPNQTCLEGTWQTFYNADYTGMQQVTVTHPDQSQTITSFEAGNGWGTNDWDTANLAMHQPTDTLVWQPGPPVGYVSEVTTSSPPTRRARPSAAATSSTTTPTSCASPRRPVSSARCRTRRVERLGGDDPDLDVQPERQRAEPLLYAAEQRQRDGQRFAGGQLRQLRQHAAHLHHRLYLYLVRRQPGAVLRGGSGGADDAHR